MRMLLITLFCVLNMNCTASEPIKIGIISDTHFLSTDLMDNMYAIQDEVEKHGRNFIALPDILDQVCKEYTDQDIDVLFVCGDLTKDGEKQSHIELRDRYLKPLYDKGVKVFVIAGNHDINMPNAKGYKGNTTFKAENISPKDFEEIYANYGYKNTISRDSHSLSYVNKLNDNTWLLAIDAAKYDEYKEQSITSGRIKTETETWIKTMLNDAKEQNAQVVAMMHWGVAEHLPMQAQLFAGYLVDDYNRIADMLADNYTKIIFTGHFHSNDISQHTSASGNTIYDVETGTLSSYPFSYRFVELYKDRVDIKTKNITTSIRDAKLAEDSKVAMKKLAVKLALPMLKRMGFDFSDEYQKRMADIAGDLFVLHLKGDEVVSDATKQQLIDVFVDMGFPVDSKLNDFEIDMPPNDNNVTLLFD